MSNKQLSKNVMMTNGEYKGLLFQVSQQEGKIKMLESQCMAADEYAHKIETWLKQTIAQIRGGE